MKRLCHITWLLLFLLFPNKDDLPLLCSTTAPSVIAWRQDTHQYGILISQVKWFTVVISQLFLRIMPQKKEGEIVTLTHFWVALYPCCEICTLYLLYLLGKDAAENESMEAMMGFSGFGKCVIFGRCRL